MNPIVDGHAEHRLTLTATRRGTSLFLPRVALIEESPAPLAPG